MSVLDRKLGRDLWRLRGQVLSIAALVACGVLTVVVMRSAFDSIERARGEYYAAERFADVFASVERAPESLASALAAVPGVRAVRTRVVTSVVLDVPGVDEPVKGLVVSIPPRRAPMLNDLHLVRGRYVEEGARDEVILSDRFAEANRLRPGDALDALMNGRTQHLRVVGTAMSPEFVYEVAAGGFFASDSRTFGVLWMARDQLAPAAGYDGAFNDIVASLEPGAREGDVLAALDRLLDPYGGAGAYPRREQLSDRIITNEMAQNAATGLIIPAVFLGVAAFLLNVVLSRLVATERTEIATLKAFGYTNAAIGRHYLGFALAAIGVGGASGVALGIWLGHGFTGLYADLFRFPSLLYRPSWPLIAMATGVCAAAAALGALAAVARATRLPPAEGMRPEAPARFRPLLLERLGLVRLIAPATRVALRNLERRPLRTMLAVLGTACATSVVITGTSLWDGIRAFVTTQFYLVQRDDAQVSFTRARPARARHELARLPGVTRVEGYRVLPARLRHGHRSRRAAITGVEAGTTLRRVIDGRGRSHAIPPGGLVLTADLARRLGVAAGDSLDVELLDRREPARRVPVVALVDEIIGSNAYIDLAALHALAREGPVLSGAYLRVEHGTEPAVFARLKRTPGVAGVASRAAMKAGFDRQMMRSMTVSMTITLVFACVIALAVVYNGARIALAERGRELASLRVLGFTEREVSTMLLGEQGIVTLAGIVAGFGLGYLFTSLFVPAYATESARMPFVADPRTYLSGAGVVAASAAVAALAVRRRISRLDLVAVLKTRE